MRVNWNAVAVVFAVVAFVLGGAVWIGTLQGQVKALRPDTAEKLEGQITSQLVDARQKLAISFENALPVGTILAFYGNTDRLPKHWRLCDGSTLDDELYAGSSYPAVPDLRGLFIRGAKEDDGAFRTRAGVDRHSQDGHSHPSGTLRAERGHEITRPTVLPVLGPPVRTGFYFDARIDVAGRTSDRGQFNLDNRPPHINVHYIIKVCHPPPERSENGVCRS